MESKQSFATFIAEKREERGLTQQQLADILQLSDTAISSWERGRSYPDITMITAICGALRIAERELIDACADSAELKKSRRTPGKIYQVTMLLLYGAAILTCFIVNLAVSGTLSWFFIVLCAVAIAFSVTSLPLLLRRHRVVIALAAATGGVFVLLLCCHLLTGGAFSLGAAWTLAAIALTVPWEIFLVARTRLNRALKSALIALWVGVFTAFCNPLIGYLFHGERFDPMLYVNLSHWDITTAGNKALFFALAAYAAVAGVYGLIRQAGRSK